MCLASRSLDRSRLPWRKLRTLLLVAVVSTSLSCETLERVAPYLVVAGGAIASVVALNYLGDCDNAWAGCVGGVQAPGYTEQVLVMIGTLTTVVGVGVDYWADLRQESRELARLEDVQAQIDLDYQQAQTGGGQGWGNAAGAQGWAAATQAPPARWGTAQTSTGPASALAPGQQAGGADAAGAPWGDQYSDGSWQSRSADPDDALSLGVAVLKRVIDRDGTRGIPIGDGDVLFDGIGENFADGFQILISPDADAFVYVVGVDAVGRVQPLYPRTFPDATNPVRGGEKILLPNTEEWYGLDSYAGLQHIYFHASPDRHADLEKQLTIFASKPPPDPLGTDGRIYSVSTPTLPEIVQARGITGVEPGEVTRIPSGGPGYEVRLDRFHAIPGQPVMAARYFDHR